MTKKPDNNGPDDDNEPDDVDDTDDNDTDDDTDDDDNDDDDASSWARLEGIIDGVVEKRLKAWRPDANHSSNASKPGKSPDRTRKPARKKGFLNGMFKDL